MWCLFKIKLSTSLKNEMIAESNDEFELPKTTGPVSLFTKLRYNYEKRIPLNKKLSVILGLTGGYSFYNDNSSNHDFAEFGYAAHYFLGGNIERPRIDTFVTSGLEENELAVTQFSMLKVAFQYNPLSDIYFTPHANIATVGFVGFNDYASDFFSPKGDWVQQFKTSLLTTIGLTASYNSIIGPVDFDISWTNKLSGARYFFGLGYHFNP